MTDDKEPRDTGTPELARQRTIVPRLNHSYSYELYVVDSNEADRLLLKGVISVVQHSSLLSFIVLLHRAKMMGPKGPAFERTTGVDHAHISEKVSEALARVGKVIGSLDKAIGRGARRELVDICMVDAELPLDRSAAFSRSVNALRVALDDAYA